MCVYFKFNVKDCWKDDRGYEFINYYSIKYINYYFFYKLSGRKMRGWIP